MAGPALDPAAARVRRYDPDLFAAALFAPEPGRGRLMLLAAVDIELSRAVQRAGRGEAGPMMAAMRLQFWRDLAAAAGRGETPRGHELAVPLAGLLGVGGLDAGELGRLIEAREIELSGEPDPQAWAQARFAAFLRAGAGLLDAGGPGVAEASAPLGAALGRAFALRHAVALAREGRTLLPLTPAERAGLAAGRVERPLADRLAALAREGLDRLAEGRALRARVPRRALPVLLPLWRAERGLRAVARDPAAALAGPEPERPARRALAYAARALTGRW